MSSHTIERSTDVAVRKSPSVSATIYPKGKSMVGNDGNVWEIIVDSRGVHRWQKKRNAYIGETFVEQNIVERTRKAINGFKMILEDEPDMRGKIEEKVKLKIQGLDMLAEDGDEEAREAVILMRNFLRESFKHGGKIKRLGEKEEMYETALKNTKTLSSRNFLLKKLDELDYSKAKFN